MTRFEGKLIKEIEESKARTLYLEKLYQVYCREWKSYLDNRNKKDPDAVALGRKGGLKGGKARAANMTLEERSEASRKAANARWGKK